MTSIPSNFARVPTLLSSQIMLQSMNRAGGKLLEVQTQLATGLRIGRPSDDAMGAGIVAVLDDLIEQRDQRMRNLSHGESVLNNVDAALSDANEILLEAKAIGLAESGVGADASTRANQAQVIDAILQQMQLIANRQYQDIHLFAGSSTATQPIQELLGGVQYVGRGEGLETDLGMARSVRITLGADQAFGAMSARVQGARDLNPNLTGQTRLADLGGARGLGISLGTVNIDVNGTDVEADLTGANTVQDVINALEAAIQTVDAGAAVQIDPASGDGIEIIPSAGVTVTISDPGSNATAADLGITGAFTGPGGAVGGDLNPRITELTRLDALEGVTFPLGTIKLSNGGQVRDVDLSSAETVRDVINLVEGLKIGVRVEIAASGDRLNFVNTLSGGKMSIAEVAGGATATELGVRSLDGGTRLSEFNGGLGVQILSGGLDPVTGLPDPSRDLDFRVTLTDGSTFDVDLAGSETVQDVLDAINAAASGAGLGVPADIEAALAADGNGIELRDGAGGGGTLSVTALNGSFAANDLGLLGDATGATLTGEDRATVAVESVFTHLIDLRDALAGNDERGIALATGKLEADLDRLIRARGDVGVRTRRIVDAADREDGLKLQDQSLKSQFQDLDYTEAAVRFATLQQQMQAALTTAANASSLSLLDFLR